MYGKTLTISILVGIIQIQAELDFEGRQMKNPTRSSPQILSVRPDLVGYLLQDVWADLAQISGGTKNIWQSVFVKKNRKKTIIKKNYVFLGLFFLAV
jgi:hypothetical protein